MTRDELDAKILSLVERCKDHGWDGYRARPIGMSAALRAQVLITDAKELPSKIVPDVDGGFGVYWTDPNMKVPWMAWVSIDAEGQCVSLRNHPSDGELHTVDFEIDAEPNIVTKALAHLRAGRPAREFTP